MLQLFHCQYRLLVHTISHVTQRYCYIVSITMLQLFHCQYFTCAYYLTCNKFLFLEGRIYGQDWEWLCSSTISKITTSVLCCWDQLHLHCSQECEDHWGKQVEHSKFYYWICPCWLKLLCYAAYLGYLLCPRVEMRLWSTFLTWNPFFNSILGVG